LGARKKVFLKITMVLAILLVAFGLFYVYWSFHTDITITYVTRTRALDADSRGEYHQERFMTVFSNPFNIPTAKPLKDSLLEFFIWNDEIDCDLLYNYAAPLHITVSAEVKGGKTIFCYDGYVTTKDGKTIPYEKEETFAFVPTKLQLP